MKNLFFNLYKTYPCPINLCSLNNDSKRQLNAHIGFCYFFKVNNLGLPSPMNETYKFVQERAEESLEHVEKELERAAKELYPFVRFTDVNARSKLSNGATHAHLQELVRRNAAIQVGKRYVPIKELKDMKIWQLRRLAEQANKEQAEAFQLHKRLKEKIEQKKEILEDIYSRKAKSELQLLKRKAERALRRRKANKKALQFLVKLLQMKQGSFKQGKTEKSLTTSAIQFSEAS